MVEIRRVSATTVSPIRTAGVAPVLRKTAVPIRTEMPAPPPTPITEWGKPPALRRVPAPVTLRPGGPGRIVSPRRPPVTPAPPTKVTPPPPKPKIIVKHEELVKREIELGKKIKAEPEIAKKLQLVQDLGKTLARKAGLEEKIIQTKRELVSTADIREAKFREEAERNVQRFERRASEEFEKAQAAVNALPREVESEEELRRVTKQQQKIELDYEAKVKQLQRQAEEISRKLSERAAMERSKAEQLEQLTRAAVGGPVTFRLDKGRIIRPEAPPKIRPPPELRGFVPPEIEPFPEAKPPVEPEEVRRIKEIEVEARRKVLVREGITPTFKVPTKKEIEEKKKEIERLRGVLPGEELAIAPLGTPEELAELERRRKEQERAIKEAEAERKRMEKAIREEGLAPYLLKIPGRAIRRELEEVTEALPVGLGAFAIPAAAVAAPFVAAGAAVGRPAAMGLLGAGVPAKIAIPTGRIVEEVAPMVLPFAAPKVIRKAVELPSVFARRMPRVRVAPKRFITAAELGKPIIPTKRYKTVEEFMGAFEKGEWAFPEKFPEYTIRGPSLHPAKLMGKEIGLGKRFEAPGIHVGRIPSFHFGKWIVPKEKPLALTAFGFPSLEELTRRPQQYVFIGKEAVRRIPKRILKKGPVATREFLIKEAEKGVPYVTPKFERYVAARRPAEEEVIYAPGGRIVQLFERKAGRLIGHEEYYELAGRKIPVRFVTIGKPEEAIERMVELGLMPRKVKYPTKVKKYEEIVEEYEKAARAYEDILAPKRPIVTPERIAIAERLIGEKPPVKVEPYKPYKPPKPVPYKPPVPYKYPEYKPPKLPEVPLALDIPYKPPKIEEEVILPYKPPKPYKVPPYKPPIEPLKYIPEYKPVEEILPYKPIPYKPEKVLPYKPPKPYRPMPYEPIERIIPYKVPPYKAPPYKPFKYVPYRYPPYKPPVFPTRKRPPAYVPRRPPVDFGRKTKELMAFKVFIRRFGEFKPLPGVYIYRAALQVGAREIETTAAATFKLGVAKTTRERVIARAKEYYRPERIRRRGELFIERRRYRITTPGELMEITYKGIEARKRQVAMLQQMGIPVVKKKKRKKRRLML